MDNPVQQRNVESPADTNVNAVATPQNLTRDEQIRKPNSGACPETGFGRAMSQ